MRKFAIKYLLFFLLIFSSIGILNYFYIKTNYWQNTIVLEKFQNIPEHIQLANVGSSHGLRNFDYSNIPYISFNFALSFQKFLYDYAILKQYINKFEKNAVLLIPISYNQITILQTNFQNQRARYYHFLDREYMDFYSMQEKMLFTVVPVMTAGNTLRFIIKDQKPAAVISKTTKEPKLTMNMKEPRLTISCINRHRSWTNDRKSDIKIREERFTKNKFLVSQMIDFCYANNIRPVLVSTPIASVLNNIYMEKTPDFFDDFYRFTSELQEAYPGLPYFDYSHDPRFENDFLLFNDCDHLNAAGAEKFTAIVLSDLQAGGLLNYSP
jgi:hypothetical protein